MAILAVNAGSSSLKFSLHPYEGGQVLPHTVSCQPTSSATIEIENMIAGIQSDTVLVVGVMDTALPQVDAGVKAAEHAAGSLGQIKDGAETTLTRIREVASATKEQSVASTSIAQRVEQIAQMVEETSTAMQATANTASEMNKIAGDLSQLVSRFRC